MRTAAALCLALACGGSALAAERVQASKPKCGLISVLMADKSIKLSFLTPGQFHFAEGLYVASPMTPPGGLPPGDGGLLVDYGGDRGGVIWTRGKMACLMPFVTDAERHQASYMPMPVNSKMIATIQTGAGETALPDDSADERKL